MQSLATSGWSLGDSLLVALLLAVVAGACWWWLAGTDRYRRAGLLAYGAAALIPLWVNGAVGIVGSEDNPANLMFVVVSGFGVVGAALVKFRAAGLVRTAQLAAGLYLAVLVLLWLRGASSVPPVAAVLALPWLVAAALLRRAVVPVTVGVRPPDAAV